VLVTTALVPLRSSLGLAGALLCALVAVVMVGLPGGLRPALLATGVGVLSSDFPYTQPLCSFRVAHMVDVVGLITFAVAAAVGGLVGRLTRQGVQASAGEDRGGGPRPARGRQHDRFWAARREAIGSIRAAFDLDTVALLRRNGAGWHVEASAGKARLQYPGRGRLQPRAHGRSRGRPQG